MEATKSCMLWLLGYLLYIIFAFFSSVYIAQDFACIFWIASLLSKPVLGNKSKVTPPNSFSTSLYLGLLGPA